MSMRGSLGVALAVGIGLIAPVAAHASSAPSASPTAAATPSVAAQLAAIKEVTFWPADNAGAAMWLNWQPTEMQTDFAQAAALRVNTVRIIIYTSAFGWPNPQPVMEQHLHDIMTMAGNDGLKVQLTLFDHWNTFWDQADTNSWMSQVLSPYANDPQLAYVELQNEVSPANAAQMSWVASSLPVLKSIVGRVPVTVSLPGGANSTTLTLLKQALGGVQPDFWDMHYYGSAQSAYSSLSADQEAAAPLPLFIGETGVSSNDPSTTGSSAQTQAQYIGVVAEACQRLGLPDPGIWTLYDFTSNFNTSDPYQNYFGLLDVNGHAKPAAAVVQSLFTTGTVPNTLNSTFTSGIGGWTPWLTPLSTVTWDPSTGDAAAGSVEITGTVANPAGVPGVFTIPVLQPTAAGQVFRLRAEAKGIGVVTPVDVVIAWYTSTGQWIGNSTSGSIPAGNSNWTTLSTSGTAPANAGYVQLYLRSTANTGPVWFDDVSWSRTA